MLGIYLSRFLEEKGMPELTDEYGEEFVYHKYGTSDNIKELIKKSKKYKVDCSDLGKPTHPKIRIIKEGDIIEDETLHYAMQSLNGSWLYNFKAAKLEAKFLGKRIPSERVWDTFSYEFSLFKNKSYGGRAYLNYDGKYCIVNSGECLYYWSTCEYEFQKKKYRRAVYISNDGKWVHWEKNPETWLGQVRCVN